MIYLFSDSHIDDGTGPFTKSGGPAALNSFLDMVGDNSLIGIGDILDLWAWKWVEIFNSPNQELVKRLQAHPHFIYNILGNHDLLPELVWMAFPNAVNWPVQLSMQIGDYTIVHGHQFDPSLNTGWKRWLAEEGDRLTTELNNPAANNIANWFQAGDRTNRPLIEALERTGKNFILGHSHVPIDMGWFINTGCWCDGNPHYATIDDNGEVTLCKWGG